MKNSCFYFELIYQSKKSAARVGKIHTLHGTIDTPGFVSVGTNGTIKSVDNLLLETIGQQLMFCNTYHLLLHPGPEVIELAGGLHKFINRKSPIITDSGGFQVFSLAYNGVEFGGAESELKRKGQKSLNNSVISIKEKGVVFRSYRDGSLIELTPESSIQIQKSLGSDIIIPLDELPAYNVSCKDLKKSIDRTHRWEKRSLDQHLKNVKNQAIYAVIHGGINQCFRKESCDVLTKLPFDGFAIGGSIGKNREEMIDLLKFVMPMLPKDKPNHLLGIADLLSTEAIIPLGVDTFDSSHPTKCARHGHLFTSQGIIKISQTKWKKLFEPVDKNCLCYTCTNYSIGFLHHLFKAHESTAHTLASIHNIAYMNKLMQNYRNAILQGDL